LTYETWDLLVVGGGGSGLSAAVEAAKLGSSVLIVDKLANIGGATGMSVGTISAAGTALQSAAGIDDDTDTHLKDYLKLIPSGKNSTDYDLELTRLLIESAPGVLDHMASLGLQYTGPHPEPPHSVPRMHSLISGSSTYISVLRAEAERAGVSIRTRVRMVELAREGAGEVSGAILVDLTSGKRVHVRTRKGVILAAGYFSANQILARKYGRPRELDSAYSLPPQATGDGIIAATAIGAEVAGMEGGSSLSFRTPCPPYVRPEPSLFDAGAILVNSEGQRFSNELSSPEVEASRQPEGASFIIFDTSLAEKIASPNEDFGPGRDGWYRHQKLFLSTFPSIAYAYIEDYRDKTSYFYESGTAQGLARLISIPHNVFKNTLDTYNDLARNNLSDPFGRPQPRVGLSNPPFYAIGPLQTSISSGGGLKIDTRMRVLDKSGTPISRLFAAGINAASNTFIAGHGHALVWAFATGQIAGKNAATIPTLTLVD
jgi:fumarate reductase flavoprotein subunit